MAETDMLLTARNKGTPITFTNGGHQDVKEPIADVLRRLNVGMAKHPILTCPCFTIIWSLRISSTTTTDVYVVRTIHPIRLLIQINACFHPTR
jgi:hypothetical protein